MNRSAFLIFFLSLAIVSSCKRIPSDYRETLEELRIFPDYTSVVIPPNVAPLNFKIENQGTQYKVAFSVKGKKTFVMKSGSGKICIPIRKWRKLLKGSGGEEMNLLVFLKNTGGTWEVFPVVKNQIAKDEIDPWIAYRKIPAANIQWKKMEIRQRSLESFDEHVIMDNSLTGDNCMNCHSFHSGDPTSMVFHMRGKFGGTFVRHSGNMQFVNTKSEHTRSAGVYPSWHPGGEIIAFSANLINQGFHSRMERTSTVIDKYSDILLYDIQTSTITRPAELAGSDLENLPSWSNDGKSLYYVLAPRAEEELSYQNIQYSLLNRSFDPRTRSFGPSDTLINASKWGKSVSFPRENPQGNLIAFVGSDQGYFTIYSPEADVFFYRNSDDSIVKPEINSEFTESYPSWSGNGRWLMFVSKRTDKLFSQVWFSYVDKDGNASKPVILPQKDPDFYDTWLYNYNRPEFIKGKVDINPGRIFSLVKKGAQASSFNERESVSISSGATLMAEKEEDTFYHHK